MQHGTIGTPELVAAEERVLMLADGILAFMQVHNDRSPDDAMNANFIAYTGEAGFFGNEVQARVHFYTLDKLDPDSQRMFCDLIKAAWEARKWRLYYEQKRI